MSEHFYRHYFLVCYLSKKIPYPLIERNYKSNYILDIFKKNSCNIWFICFFRWETFFKLIRIQTYDGDTTGYLQLEKTEAIIGCFDIRYKDILAQCLGCGIVIKKSEIDSM